MLLLLLLMEQVRGESAPLKSNVASNGGTVTIIITINASQGAEEILTKSDSLIG